MQNNEIRHIKVGFFVLVALAVAMLFIFMIGSEKSIFRSQYTLSATFADISGLRIGAPVQLAGLNIGQVSDIRFPKDLAEKKIVVKFKIAKKFQDRVREDSVATINTQGLLGDKFIFVTMGSPDKPVIEHGGMITSREVVGIYDLAEKGGEILTDIQKAVNSASKVFQNLSEGKGDVAASLSSLRVILEQAEKGKGLVHSLIFDPDGEKISKDVSEVVNNLRNITKKVDDGEGTIGALIADPTIYQQLRAFFGKANRNLLMKSLVRATIKENERQVLK